LKYLLELGCNVNISDVRGQTPVNFAIRHNKPQFIGMLVDAGAKPPQQNASKKNPRPRPPAPQVSNKVNERRIPKEFVL